MSTSTPPKGYHSVTPYLTVGDAKAALDFYSRAFDADSIMTLDGPGGKVMHAEMRIGDSTVMLADEFPEWGNQSPASLGGTPCSLMIYFDDVDAMFDRAVAAGATVIMPVQDQFYGDRSGSIKDPFGHQWTLSKQIEQLSAEEIERRASEWAQQS